MPLVLTLHRARDPGDRQRETRTVDDGTLSIGRGTDNGWVLQDPAQHLSKTHCIVAAGRSGYTLTDCSSNGTFLNGSKQRMNRDSRAALNDGDEFALGDYLIQARIVADLSHRAAAAPAAPRFAPAVIERDDPFGLDEFLAPQPTPAPSPAPQAFDPFADPARSSRLDPFGDDDDILGSAPPPRRPFDEPGAPLRRTAPPDPFEARGSSPGPISNPAASTDPFGADDDLFRGTTPAVQWQGPSQPDAIDAVHGAYLPPKPIVGSSADSWDDLLGDTPPGSPPIAASVAAPPPPPSQAAPLQAAPPPTPPASAEPSRLVAAFLDGAGVAGLDVAKQDPEQYMHAAGALFGLMVESLRDVLMSRAAVKSEFGLDQTMLRPRENNALKFSITPTDAVAALLQPGKPGYMDPLRATREAFDDVRTHQVAVMAGVQAALFNLLRTFDPVALEARLQKGGVIESLLPGTRRAKLWEAFVATYKEIARDADADFQDVFGREFARAYNQQAKNE